jgi:hypothetical protein
MTKRAQWLVLSAFALAGFAIGAFVYRVPAKGCEGVKHAAAVSLRATEICTGQMVGCRLTFNQIERVLQQQEAAKVCR